MKIKLLITLVTFALYHSLTGCATIVSGTTQQITFQSTPDGAVVRLNGRELGKTPLTLMLEKKDPQLFTVEKEGFKTYEGSMSTSLDPMFWGNIIFGGVIGSTTDSASGAMHQYAPDQYMVTLEPMATSQLNTFIHLSKREQARSFLFQNYENIKSDLSKNSGEYIDALLQVLNVPKENSDIVKVDLHSTIFKNSDPAWFVKHTLNKYFNT